MRATVVSTSETTATLDVKSLETWLWDAACQIRGPLDAPKFKDYILPLIFLKRLSDVFDDEVQRVADEVGDLDTAKEVVDEDHALVRFYLPAASRWPALALKTTGLGEALTDAVRAVARQNPRLQGVIDTVDFNATTAGQPIVDNDRLTALVKTLGHHRLGLRDVQPDLLGNAYEYLIRKFAEGQGQSAGEFYTPAEVGRMMARLLDPQPGMTVYDPCCGSSGLLIKCHLRLLETHGKAVNEHRELPPEVAPLKLFGQEINPSTFAMSRMNAFLHDMDAEIALGDTMRSPAFTDRSGHLRHFDLVTANPMWNQDFSEDVYRNDTTDRFANGIPPSSSADWGWVQHMMASLNPNGRMAIVLDAAAATRGSGDEPQHKEKRIRRAFVESDLVEGVILLPENLFYNTPAQGIILLMNKNKSVDRRGQIILIDASSEFERDRPKNMLSDAGILRISQGFDSWQSEVDFAAVVGLADVENKDFNLNPARYVTRSDTRSKYALLPAVSVLQDLRDSRADLEQNLLRLVSSTYEVTAPELIDDGWSEVVFGEIAEFSLGRTPPRKRRDCFSTVAGYPWVTITDMANQRVITSTKEFVTQVAADEFFRRRLVRKGSLLMSIKLTIGRTSFMGVDGYHNEAIVAVTPDETHVLPAYLYYLLPLIDYRQYQDRAVKGQTINSGKLRRMKLFLPPVAEQLQIVNGLEALQELTAIEHAIASQTVDIQREIVFQLTSGSMRIRRAP